MVLYFNVVLTCTRNFLRATQLNKRLFVLLVIPVPLVEIEVEDCWLLKSDAIWIGT
jgi:hypothetical protein